MSVVLLASQIYTGSAVLILAFMDHDVSPELAEKVPQLYAVGPKNTFFSLKIFAGWVVAVLGFCKVACRLHV